MLQVGNGRTAKVVQSARRRGGVPSRTAAVAAALAAVVLAGCGGGGGEAEAPTTVFGREARELAVGIAAQYSDATVDVQTTVLAQDGTGASGLTVELAGEGGPWIRARPCGEGRYCGAFDAARPDPALRVRVTRENGRSSTVAARLPADPRPERAAAIVRDTVRAIRALSSWIVQERLGSGPPYPVLDTTFTFVAPNRMSYAIEDAGQAVVVGRLRWDRENADAAWEQSEQDPLDVPAPDWRRALHASLLGEGTREGRPVWRVTFYDPTVPAWFEMDVDTETNLPLWLEMIGAAHFMTHTYRAFNAPLVVVPPVPADAG